MTGRVYSSGREMLLLQEVQMSVNGKRSSYLGGESAREEYLGGGGVRLDRSTSGVDGVENV